MILMRLVWFVRLALVSGVSCGGVVSTAIAASSVDNIAGAGCFIDSPLNAIGGSSVMAVNGVTYTRTHRPDAPGPLEVPTGIPVVAQADNCTVESGYRFGSGLYDTTGPIGGRPVGHSDLVGHVVPTQVPNGIHMRLFARAFVVESPCNSKRVMMVTDDHAFPSGLLRQEVLRKISEDPALAAYYGSENIMLSSTHTHATPGGYGEPGVFPELDAGTPQVIVDLYKLIQGGASSVAQFDSDNFRIVSDGIVQAIRRAHANLEAHPQVAGINMSVGELLNANSNRSPLGYRQNSPSERAGFVDSDGNEIDVDKRFLQLNFVRNSGSAVGVLNWFGVHPTAMGNHNRLVSSDTKGYAALGFEKLMGTKYKPDVNGVADGADNFVAAFSQSGEGDSVPDLFVLDKGVTGSDFPGFGVPYRYRFGTEDPFEFNEPGFALGAREAVKVHGTKHLAQAIKQFDGGGRLTGPVDYRFFYVDMSKVVVADPAVLTANTFADLPGALYADNPKKTCTAGSGVAFAAGAPNGLGFLASGFACSGTAPSPYFLEARTGYNGLFNGQGSITVYDQNTPSNVPFDGVAVTSILAPVFCAAKAANPKMDCQAEKPVAGEFPGEFAPLQIFRIGNLAVLGVPWEVTTMAARRLKKAVMEVLAPVGVDTVVISGISNGYLNYMTTREEYSAQMYEGASTPYGPWQLAAAMQEYRRLAQTMVDNLQAPIGPQQTFSKGATAPITVDFPANFGALLNDALPLYTQGNVVDVSWQGGYPGNDPKTMSSYLYVERQNSSGGWDVVATDKDAELVFLWTWSQSPALTLIHAVDSSMAIAQWTIPKNTPPGKYRIRHEGVSRISVHSQPTPYTGVSRVFQVSGIAAACP
ncbi:neutral/alkaline non-lysosomal ceramidase N-terminal domain-containing protein [Pseudomonas sp. GCM10022186]|uniref:neutral/alkaline non-lysosomal ceramidase N-terminal domain-containing protein n=1 Tax=Pseudomonas sp. GCM10022186 TaxID=3252650 RepID=UPI0036203A6A